MHARMKEIFNDVFSIDNNQCHDHNKMKTKKDRQEEINVFVQQKRAE